MTDLLIGPTARKHRITDVNIRHAVTNAVDFWALDEGMDIYLGPAFDGSLLEVGVVVDDVQSGLMVAVHAMKARPKFIRTNPRR